ncbi:hypothetical protein [Nonlabens ponticola]|uniref:Uncharacterized protein n=1 Tax=Nonlabens ponticola TaxID=2496866 RepID=A0A3S9MZJ6_9FLAO|nr:hypothetical protein [Nonlabens ponticola]AZQ44554.1 hypothetical protein EJ995_09965 [Nonlabens ponticola]
MEAIIAGDIINSQQHDPEAYLTVLQDILKEHSSDGMFQIYRGDSYQALLTNPEQALHACIKIKAALKKTESLDTRVAIGLGDVTIIDNNIAVSTGSALTRSGELLDSLKEKGHNLLVNSGNSIDNYMNTSLRLAMLYMDGWTTNSAETVYELLDQPDIKQDELGKRLGVKQATASRRLDRANWKETQQLLRLFQQFYKDISHAHSSSN